MTTIVSKILGDVYTSYDPYDDEDGLYYEYFIDELQTIVDKAAYTTGNWLCTGRNMDWRGSYGVAFFSIEDVQKDLLDKITPRGDWSARVYVEGRTITLVISHHDCPTGSTYVFKPSRKIYID